MRSITIVALLLITGTAWSQTTVILVRHAEKVKDGKDPVLTEAGLARAQELVRVLADTPIDEIYTTPFNRTRLTVEPLANKFGIEVQEYNPFDLPGTTEMIKNAAGKTLVFSGHSNTTPILVNLLLEEERYRPLDEGDYDNLYIVTIYEGKSSVVQLSYGEPSKF